MHMKTTPLVSRAAATLTGGLIILGGVAAAPALAYPAGSNPIIACDASTYAPGATAECTLSNLDPAGPNDIMLGGSAMGEAVTAALAPQEASTYTELVSLPTMPGTYEVVGTTGAKTVSTTVEVVAGSTGDQTASTTVDVVAGSTGGAATTPQTGASVGIGLAAGLIALGLGGGLVVASRRSRA